jgi:predicted GNAT family N-acyltransferase
VLDPEGRKPKFSIEPFDKKKHDRTAFSCGVEALDNYLKNQANQDLEKRVAPVFVLTADGKTIAGFYTLSQYLIDVGHLPDNVAKRLRLPKYPELPATLLGRLAVSASFKGQKLGEILLISALKRALDQSKSVASMAVVVDAKDENAKAFYQKYGFIEMPGHHNRLFLPMATVEQVFA